MGLLIGDTRDIYRDFCNERTEAHLKLYLGYVLFKAVVVRVALLAKVAGKRLNAYTFERFDQLNDRIS